MTGVYKITSPSGKIYIGSSINIEKRISYYISSNCKGQTKLYNSIKKYSWVNHIFEVIKECQPEELYILEEYYGNLYDVLSPNGLNCHLPKSGEIKKTISDETKKRMSESKKGEKNYWFGQTLTKETREKMSNSKIGKTPWNKGKKFGFSNTRAKAIIDTNTGEIYKSCIQCSKILNINYSTLRGMLNGGLKNRTSLKYL